jgi:hypothetical protein
MSGFHLPGSISKAASLGVIIVLVLASCSVPTLVQIARRRQASEVEGQSAESQKDDVRVKYYVTDLDVLNFIDEVKRKLMNRANLHVGFAYGASGSELTLGALAGAAKARRHRYLYKSTRVTD